MESKRKEGERAMVAGQKLEKVSLTRWKPDFEAALAEYEQAIKCFRQARDHAAMADACAKAADMSHALGLGDHAARQYESGAAALKDAGDLARAADFYDNAAAVYADGGMVDKAAAALCNGAKAVEPANEDRAAAMYTRAAEMFADDESRPVEFSIDPYRQAAAFLLRTRRLREAVRVLELQLGAHWVLRQKESAGKCALSAVVARLHADDFVGALGFLTELQEDPARADVAGTSEARAAAALLDAFRAQSEDDLQGVLKRADFKYLDNEAIRLARGLTLQAAEVPVAMVTGAGRPAAAAPGPQGGGLPPLPPPPPGLAGEQTAAAAQPQGQPVATGDFGEVLDEYTDDLT